MSRRPRILDDVRGEILDDIRPVRTLSSPWRRALVLLPWLVVCLLLMSAMMRPDYGEVSKLLLWGGSVFFWASAYLLLVACMREAIPGSTISWKYLGAGVAAVLVGQVLLAAALHERTPYLSPEQEIWRTIVACTGAISLLGAPLLTAGCVLAARGYPVRPAFAGVLLAVVAVVAAESVWRLHCPYTSPEHLISTHWLPFVVLAPVGGYLLVRLGKRR